jgi:hypothetical protein
VQSDDVLWITIRIADQRKPPTFGADLAVATDKALGIFVGIPQPPNQFAVPFGPGGAFLWMNDVVLLFGVA